MENLKDHEQDVLKGYAEIKAMQKIFIKGAKSFNEQVQDVKVSAPIIPQMAPPRGPRDVSRT